MYAIFGNQIIGSVFFTLVAFGCAYIIIGARNLRHLLVCAAIIASPWAGGLWIPMFQMDIRLSGIFILLSFFHSFTSKPLRSAKLHENQFIVTPLIIFAVWSLICSFPAVNPNRAFGGVFTFFMNAVYFVAILRNIKSTTDFNLIIKSLFLSIFLTSLLGLVQYKSPFFALGFVDRGFTTFMHWRARSTFYHANQYGFYHLLILPIIFRYIIMMYGMKKMNQVRLYGALFFMGIFTLYITSNRGSWLGFAAGFLITIAWDFVHSSNKKSRRVLMRVTAVLTVVLLLASIRYGGRIYERFYGNSKMNANAQAEARAELNVDAYRIINENPVMGVGIWNFQYHSTQVIFTHNLYLLVLSQTGYPGLVIFLIPILGLLITAVRLKMNKNFYVSNMGNALLTAIISMLIASYPGPDYWQSDQVSIQLWIVAAIVIGFHHVFEDVSRKKKMQERYNQLKQNETGAVKPPALTHPKQSVRL